MANSQVDPSAVKRWWLFPHENPRPATSVTDWSRAPEPKGRYIPSNYALAVQLNNNQLCFIRRKQPR